MLMRVPRDSYAQPLEPIYDLLGAALGCNREELGAQGPPHGLMPMQGTGEPNHPISPQPGGQEPFRAVCGVAALANSGLLAAHRALHPIPKRFLRDPQ